MLNFKERHRILLSLHYSHQLSLYPARIDTKTWKLHARSVSKWKARLCRLNYGSFLAHVLYKSLALVYSLLVLTGIPLHQILIHAVFVVFGLMIGYFHLVLHFQNGQENALFVRMTLTGDLAGGK